MNNVPLPNLRNSVFTYPLTGIKRRRIPIELTQIVYSSIVIVCPGKDISSTQGGNFLP